MNIREIVQKWQADGETPKVSTLVEMRAEFNELKRTMENRAAECTLFSGGIPDCGLIQRACGPFTPYRLHEFEQAVLRRE